MENNNDRILELWKEFKQTNLIRKVNFVLKFFGWAIIIDDKRGGYPIRIRLK